MLFQQPGEDYQQKIHDYRAGKKAREGIAARESNPPQTLRNSGTGKG